MISLLIQATFGNLKGDSQKISRPACFHRTNYPSSLLKCSDVHVAYRRQIELGEGGWLSLDHPAVSEALNSPPLRLLSPFTLLSTGLSTNLIHSPSGKLVVPWERGLEQRRTFILAIKSRVIKH